MLADLATLGTADLASLGKADLASLTLGGLNHALGGLHHALGCLNHLGGSELRVQQCSQTRNPDDEIVVLNEALGMTKSEGLPK